MGYKLLTEEGADAIPGEIEDIIRDDDMPGSVIFAQRSAGANADEAFDAQ